jgi:immune inhibitor A
MMNKKLWLTLVTIVVLITSVVNVSPALANPPAPDDATTPQTTIDLTQNGRSTSAGKTIDQVPAEAAAMMQKNQKALDANRYDQVQTLGSSELQDRVLVVLVEFGGTDKFTWTPGVSTWDPIGTADTAEDAPAGDCSKVTGIPTVATDFTYGPVLHNEIEKPRSEADRSGDSIWTPDFNKDWYNAFMWGNGVKFDYTRRDGSTMYRDFTGKSVRQYFADMSGGKYDFGGDVIGWIQVPHSVVWYGADTCPGRRSVASTVGIAHGGAIPEAGTAASLVMDSLNKVEEMRAAGELPGFDWKNYDLNGDNVIDRLWIVHAGLGEEDSTTLLNRTSYGENNLWSHSSSVTRNNTITGTTMKAGAYIMMPENGGIGVFAHEYAHNLGADDLYAYGNANLAADTSTGFFALQADDWTGYPIGFLPPAVDPWHLDNWGWLEPKVIVDPAQDYTVTIGQASDFPGGVDANGNPVYRAAKIVLPTGKTPRKAVPNGNYYWVGGNLAQMNSMMTLKEPISIPATGTPALKFNIAYNLEPLWDFMWVQASDDGGTTWDTLTNTNSVCNHDKDWIGEINGFPKDMCAAGIGGFTGENTNFPTLEEETFDLTAYQGKDILVRLWYMTDWGTQYDGVFVDDLGIYNDATTLLSDSAETDSGKWAYSGEWEVADRYSYFTHNYYFQLRNTASNGGYDAGLGDPKFRYGPVNSGVLVWYNNNNYSDNEAQDYMLDYPAFGPKGRMLVVDSHPEPIRDPVVVAAGFNNELANLPHRMLMRDAPFSLIDTVPFTYAGQLYERANSASAFDDSHTYYPGLDYTTLVPGGAMRWITKQWDASVVVPSSNAYGVDAPGYVAGTTTFRTACAWDDPTTYTVAGCYAGTVFGSADYSIPFSGDLPDPASVNGQYGWRMQIVSQTDKTATLHIWNTRAKGALEPSTTRAVKDDTVNFTYNLPSGSGTSTYSLACVDLDTTKVEFVSAAKGAQGVTASCADLMGADIKAAADATEVKSVVYVPTSSPALSSTAISPTGWDFNFDVKVKASAGTINLAAKLYGTGTNAGKVLDTIWGSPVQITAPWQFLLPMILQALTK